MSKPKDRQAARAIERPVTTGYKRRKPTGPSSTKAGSFDAANLTAAAAAAIAVAAVIAPYADDWAEGFSAVTGQGPGGRGGVAKPTEGGVIAPYRTCPLCGGETPCVDHPDQHAGQVWAYREGGGLAAQAADVVRDIDAIGVLVRRVIRVGERIASLKPDVASELAEQKKLHKLGAGGCQCCGTIVTGVAEDRLRSNYCPACYKAWERAGRPSDRALFDVRRRVHLNAKGGDTAGDDETPDDDASSKDRGKACDNGSDLRPASGES